MTTTRRAFLAAAALYLGALPACELARAAERMKRVGIVGWKIISADEYWAPFYQEMQERSWIEGRNVVYERRFFDPGDVGAISAHLAELIALDVDVIHVQGAQAALAAKSASKRIPIVFYVGDAVGRGVVANLARPESNLTGISSQFVEETAKRLELLKQIAPRISRVAALYNTDLGHPTAIFGEPKPRGVAIFMVTLRAPVDLLAAMEAVSHGGADAILVAQVWPRPFNGEIVSAIARTRLPAIYLHREFIELGGLISFGAWVDYRGIATYIDRILRGAKPGELPVEQQPTPELAINLRTAKALGITVPQELIVRADLIVE